MTPAEIAQLAEPRLNSAVRPGRHVMCPPPPHGGLLDRSVSLFEADRLTELGRGLGEVVVLDTA
jgi:hypothetical protein